MVRSLGLAAYRAMARRGAAPAAAETTPRPPGELVWIHVGEVSNMLAVQNLAARLIATRRGLHILITLPSEGTAMQSAPRQQDTQILQVTAPSEHPAAVRGFLDHWMPDAALWVWGGLHPNLVLAATDRGCPMMLIDADSDGFDRRQSRWLPDVTRQVLSCFTHIFARSAAGQRRLTQLGGNTATIKQTSALLAGGQVLPCIDSDLTELAAAMGGRPAWFAANVLPQEVPIVLRAHKQAMRLSHRLLLILQPAGMGEAEGAAVLAAQENLSVARWDEGQYPDETTQIMISEERRDQGLFFRVAPVSFLGSTLSEADGGCDPLDAAALGSAVLYGPKVRHYLPSYSRLAAAGAARIVNDADALGTAVTRLVAPDHAAAMAHAGWDVISSGAELTDKVIDLVTDILDTAKSHP